MLKGHNHIVLIFLLVMVRTLSMVIINSWLGVWVILEINIFCFLPIIIHRASSAETEACVKYFFIQAPASIVLLLSTTIPFNYLSSSLLLCAILTKLGTAPLHSWFPSVVENVKWWISLLLITWQKLGPLLLLIITTPIINRKGYWVLLTCVCLSPLVGGLGGYRQTNIRTIIAYSSITHVGWILSPLLLNLHIVCLLYFIIYSFLTIPIIQVLNKSRRITVSDNIAYVHNISVALLFLSLSGLPPLTGFLPKLAIFTSMSQAIPLIMLLLILGSLLNMVFYLSVVINRLMTTRVSNVIEIKTTMIYCAVSTLGLLPLL